MSRQVARSLALALAGLAAGLGLVLVLFGGPDAVRRLTGSPAAEAPPVPPPAADVGAKPQVGLAAPGSVSPAEGGPGAAAEKPTAAPGPRPAAEAPQAPSFDIVRVEPNGEAVVAGRGTPNTVVEMLVDGKPVARALADPSGQFAIVPPALPAGSSEIALRARDADGREARSKQSVAVAVSPKRDSRPLVALTAPDGPTVVLSQPGAPEPPAAAGIAPAPQAGTGGKPAAGAQRPVRIVSVDAEPGGRLYVTGAAPPGASLRLYLNDTLIAPASAGADGTVTFTIGRGVKPGRYQVRIDQTDPATGKVRGRAEAPFTMPEAVAVRTPPPEAPHPGAGVAGMAAGKAAPAGPGATPPAPEAHAAAGEAPSGGPGGRAGPPPRETGPARAEADRPGATPPSLAEIGAGRPAQDGAARARQPSDRAEMTAAAPPATGPARAGAVFVPEISTARISRGDNLWQISKRTYGRGERYTVIYDANQDQIRDPDLIYPGQIFVLPNDKRG